MDTNFIKNKKKSNFLRVRTPRFLRMPVTGINISDHSIKIMKMSLNRDGVKIDKHADIKIEEGVVVSGNIKNDKKLIQILTDIRKKHNIDFINASIPEENVYLFKTEFPHAIEENIRETVSFQLEEYVPLKAEETIFNFEIINKKNEKNNIELSVSAIPRNFISRYLKIFNEAGMIPVSLEIEAQAIKRAIVDYDSKDTHMILDIGRTRTGISIISEGVLRYTSTVSIGGDALSKAIQKYASVPIEEADKMKQNIGFESKTRDVGMYESLVVTISALEDEIKKRILYWNEHTDKGGKERKAIKEIIICGGNASIPGLKDHISFNVKLPTQVANVWSNLFCFEESIPPIDLRHSLSYATVIGLSMKDISF